MSTGDFHPDESEVRENNPDLHEKTGSRSSQRDGEVFARIYEIVKRIPEGKVTTYGQVALLAGNPRLSRVVGYALHVNPEPGEIPCHRVVNRFGEVSRAFAFGGGNMQIELLEREGVEFVADRVPLERYMWYGEELQPK